ncbi:hypothetical protein CHS0354_026655 [Potamilus streckersoni]|uniref:Uncharacterized protein n=1 Tax=Potamilus streckersoni TaxID=2493646 RepID=A0AAE0S849_9BIVA|nr:hypothetical protein CHS0354_026655 [Potamilus streckersoni]
MSFEADEKIVADSGPKNFPRTNEGERVLLQMCTSVRKKEDKGRLCSESQVGDGYHG